MLRIAIIMTVCVSMIYLDIADDPVDSPSNYSTDPLHCSLMSPICCGRPSCPSYSFPVPGGVLMLLLLHLCHGGALLLDKLPRSAQGRASLPVLSLAPLRNLA